MTISSFASRQRFLILSDIAIVLIYILFLWAPWGRGVQATPATLTWLVLPVTLARHGVDLANATEVVTIFMLAVGAVGALLSIVARVRGSAPLWAAGAWLFGLLVAILMPVVTAIGFLGTLLLVVALRARFIEPAPASTLSAVLQELWPVAYTGAFAVLAWRYNPQLLLKALLITLGASLVARAVIPPAPQVDTLPTS